MLVEDVTADPVISSDGKYIWAVSGNEIYLIDMTGGEPKSKSINVNGLAVVLTGYGYSLPITLCDDGKSAYCIGDLFLDHENEIFSGTLYYIDMEKDSISMIDNDVVHCISD